MLSGHGTGGGGYNGGSANLAYPSQAGIAGLGVSEDSIASVIYNLTELLEYYGNDLNISSILSRLDSLENNVTNIDGIVTWTNLRSFIDTIFPIGILMMSTNGSPPDSFSGYITWTLYSVADSKYLKMTVTGANVGTAQVQSLLAHAHTLSSLTIGTVADHAHAYSGTVASDGAHIHSSVGLSLTMTPHSHTLTPFVASTQAVANHTHGLATNSIIDPAGSHSHTLASGVVSTQADHSHALTAAGTSTSATHTHALTAAGTSTSATHTHALTAAGTSTSATHTHTGSTNYTGTSTAGEGEHQHIMSKVAYGGSTINALTALGISGSSPYTSAATDTTNQVRDALGVFAGTHQHAFTTAAGGAHSHTLTGSSDAAGAHSHTLTGSSDAAGAHSHTLTGSSDAAGSHLHTLSGTTNTELNHTHLLGGITDAAGTHQHQVTGATDNTTSGGSVSGSTASNGTHTHTYAGTSANAGSHTHTLTSGTIDSTGVATNEVTAVYVLIYVRTA